MNTKNIFALFVFLLIGLKSNSQVVINEVMHKPGPTTFSNQGMARKEYVEIYNNSCTPVDISCWIIGSSIKGGLGGSDYLGSFQFPSGTTIGANQHLVIGATTSQTGTPYPAAAIDFDVQNVSYAGSYACNISSWVLPNQIGMVALYDQTGAVKDAIYWGGNADIIDVNATNYDSDFDSGIHPCKPTGGTNSCPTISGNLKNAVEIYTTTPSLITYVGNPTSFDKTFSRLPDGGTWSSNVNPSIIGSNCNGGTCNQTFTISAAITSPTCGASDGSIIITPNPAGAYTYTWSPNVSTTNTATNLQAGTYTISVDGGGCVTNTLITLTSAGAPTITATQITAPSCGGSDGSATITATPADSYTWSSGVTSTTNTANNLASGDYTVTLSLAGCITNTIITIPSQTCCPSSIATLSTVTNNTICNASSTPCNYTGPSILINEIGIFPTSNDGSIYGPGQGGAGSGEGEWIELFNPDWCNSVDISGYILGSYNSTGSVLQPASNGMSFVLPQGTIVPPLGFVIVRGTRAPAPPAGVIDIIVSNTGNRLCIDGGVTTNRVWFQNSGGWFAFYNASGVMQDAIKWGNPTPSDLNGNPCLPTTNSVTAANTPLASANQGGAIVATLTFTISTAGTTYVRIPDGGAWSTSSATLNTLGSCNVPGGCVSGGGGSSNCSGSAEIVTTAGTAPYTYTWNDPLNQTTATSYSLCSGTYSVVVRDANSCTQTITVNIASAAQPTITSVASNSATCGLSNASATVSANPSSVTYTWTSSVGSALSNTSVLSNVTKGTYTITINDGSCSTSSVIVINGSDLDINITATTTPSSCENNDGVLLITNSFGVAEPFLYSINGTTPTVDTVFQGLSSGIYTITVQDSYNCSITQTYTVSGTDNKPDIIVPNVFTPNNDAKNDFWFATPICIKDYKLTIYNRWGNKVIEISNPNDKWDGSGANDGTYYYVLEAKGYNNEEINKTGFITITR